MSFRYYSRKKNKGKQLGDADTIDCFRLVFQYQIKNWFFLKNRKLKILYKCVKANTSAIMVAYAAHTTNYSTHRLTARKQTKIRATQTESLTFGI